MARVGNAGERGGLASNVVSSFRKCLGSLLWTEPPEPAPEVEELLATLQVTHRQVHSLYRTFLELKQHDPLMSTTGPNEASTSSMIWLVRTKRQWVAKILLLLLDLAGYSDTVTWDGFLYVFLQFCTLTKLELCQVMFFVIAKQMKSWTVHYLTSTQLQEFYGDYEKCPVKSFDTGAIDFTMLSLAKYYKTDFIELVYRLSQLINPCMHLQRSLQQVLPSMKFWADYDRPQACNRRITIDFFRYKKVRDMTELVAGAMEGAMVQQALPRHLSRLLGVQAPAPEMGDLRAARQAATERAMAEVKQDAEVADCLQMPLGPTPPLRQQRAIENMLPVWLDEHLKLNLDPITGMPLGSGASELPQGKRPWEGPCATCSIEEAKAAILQTFGPALSRAKRPNEFIVTMHTRPSAERREAITRSQELEFIRKARHDMQIKENMVDIMERHCQGALIDRPVRRIQMHL